MQRISIGEAIATGSPTWTGDVDICDLCGAYLDREFIDGATAMGPRAILCPSCHRSVGRGLGTGKGQRYELGPKGTWYKTEG